MAENAEDKFNTVNSRQKLGHAYKVYNIIMYRIFKLLVKVYVINVLY